MRYPVDREGFRKVCHMIRDLSPKRLLSSSFPPP